MSTGLNAVEKADRTTDHKRASMLENWTDLIRDTFGEEPLLMPLREETKEPAISGRCGLDTDEARSMLVEPQEAARRIREEGANGFFVYAGKPDHRTEHLAIFDHDDVEEFPTPTGEPTLLVESGSGTGRHEYYRNDPNDPVRNAFAHDSAGEVKAHNWGAAVPGSIHPSGGTYGVIDHRPVATVADSDLTDELRPSSWTKNIPEDFEIPSFDRDDMETIGIVRECIRELNNDMPEGGSARDYLQDLKEGKYRKHGFETNRGNADRSRAEFALFRCVYGAILEYGGISQQQAAEAAGLYLTHLSKEDRTTQDGQPRKWLTNPGRYRKRIVTQAVGTHDDDAWRAWRDDDVRDDYHSMIYQYLLDAIEDLSEGEDGYDPEQYPEGRRVRGIASVFNDAGLEEETYRTALSELVNQRGEAKMACIKEGVEYVYYPMHAPDPPEAEWVRDLRGDHQPKPDEDRAEPPT